MPLRKPKKIPGPHKDMNLYIYSCSTMVFGPKEEKRKRCCRNVSTVNVLKFQFFFFLFSNNMLVFRAGIHKMLVRIANRKTLIRLLLKKQPDSGLHCLSGPFSPANSIKNFRIFQSMKKVLFIGEGANLGLYCLHSSLCWFCHTLSPMFWLRNK